MEAVDLTLDNCRTYFLVSGGANALAALVWTFLVFFGGLLTCGLGCVLFFLPIITGAVMIFDFVAASKIGSPPSPQVYSFLKLTAILDMAACSAILPLIMGILNIQLLARPEIYRHFHPDTLTDGRLIYDGGAGQQAELFD